MLRATSILASIIARIAVYLWARREGKKQAEAEKNETDLEAIRKVENFRRDLAANPDAANRLRDKYRRR